MSALFIAQYMVAAAFFAVAITHALVWLLRRGAASHFCFALTAAAAGANAIAEASMYGATDVDTMAVAVRWYVAMSGVWIVALNWFVVVYTRLGRVGCVVAVVVSATFAGALIVNFFSRSSFLYTELIGLREILLPWGETIRLVEGHDNPWRFVTEIAFLGVLGLVAAGWLSLRRQGQAARAWLFAGSVSSFLFGFESTNGHPDHIGLEIMRERAGAIAADIQVESSIGEGTVVKVRYGDSRGDVDG